MIEWVLTASLFLHLVATVVWLGGLALLTIVIWPESRKLIGRHEHGDALLALLDSLRKRFYPLANLSLIVLLVTGLFQMDRDPNYDGLLQFTNDWTRAILLKHVAVLGMLIIGAVMQWGVLPALERAALRVKLGQESSSQSPDIERLRKREQMLSILNLILGMIVLLFTAMATSI